MMKVPRPRSGLVARIRGGGLLAGLGWLLLAVTPLAAAEPEPVARTIRVPLDHPLISRAVAAALPGDIVEVDDGYYFERDLILDKPLTLRSRNLYGAVIYGSMEPGVSIFIVRAPVDISGFVFRDSYGGIRQRDSPDVEWTGHDLAFIGLKWAVYIDDRFVRIGSARLWRLILEGCEMGVLTNEARRIRVERCFASRTVYAFNGSNHESFQVDRAVLWDCREPARRDELLVDAAGGTNRIDLGPEVWTSSPRDPEPRRREFFRRLKRVFAPGPRDPGETRETARRREALLLAAVGRALLDAGDAAGAKAAFRESLIRAEETGLLDVRWQALLGLAQTADMLGQTASAAERYRLAIEAIEETASRLPRRGYISSFLKDKIDPYEAIIRLLLSDRQGKAPGSDARRAAFLWADRSKARSDRASLRRPASARAVTGPVRPLSTQESDGGVSRAQISLLDPEATPAAVAARLRRLEAAESRRLSLTLMGSAAAAWGRPSAPAGPPSATIEDLESLVQDGSAALLEYVVTPQGSRAFFLSRDGLTDATLPDEDDLRQKIGGYLKFLTSREPRRFLGWAGGAELRRILLGPFESLLRSGIRRLIIIPDGPLHYLPFEALPEQAPGHRFLVEDYEVSYAASAAFLLDLRRRGGPAAYRMEFLGLAASEPFQIWTPAEGGPMRFPALPFAAAEVRTIGRMFPRAGRTVLTGRAASERRLKALPAGDYRILHIAAHGFFQNGSWWRSAMRLMGEPDATEDGLLQPDEIESLGFQGELVVLSGCRTGGLELRKGNGLLGLTSSFFAAGARSLLLSLWSVNDRSTARFMRSFYRAWRSGRTKSQALRQAKNEARVRGEPPYVWAAFVLMGD